MIKQAELEKLFYWIREREKIRVARERGKPPPWTKDSILRHSRFCNVMRRHDRVTQYIMQWLERPMTNISASLGNYTQHLIFLCSVARWFNEPETLRQMQPYVMGGAFLPARVLSMLESMAFNQCKIFNAAYIITGAVVPKGMKMPKYQAVVQHVLLPLYKEPLQATHKTTLEELYGLLRQRNGMGSFMAGQVVADVQTFRDGVYINAIDKRTWAPIGPGSKKGLNLLHGRDLLKTVPEKQCLEEMREAFQLLGKEMPTLQRQMTLHDMQNCFCEFSKFRRGYGKQQYDDKAQGKLL